MRALAVNTGSSSLKLAWFEGERRIAERSAAGLGTTAAFQAAFAAAVAAFAAAPAPDAVSHRVVAPLDWSRPRQVDAALLAELHRIEPLAPDHLPQALACMAAARDAFPGAVPVACSDSAFHASMTEASRTLPLPRAWRDLGARRFGYHGLSCESVLMALASARPAPLPSRIVVAHLGAGASLTAIRDGQSVDTTMGLTPLGGLVMATRSGDLDPGVGLFLLRQRGLDLERWNHGLNHEAGLLGLSSQTGDMKVLLASSEPAARLAVECFVRESRKHLGAMVAVLGGVDLLVFTGGIGEHAADIRERIVAGLEWMIPQVQVMPADEERVLARHAARLLGGGGGVG
jgi:acetate kinase